MNLQLLIAGDDVPDLELAGLCEHTGEVRPGFAFIAVAANDELFDAHCEAAVSAGAVVILCAPHRAVRAVDANVPVVPVADVAARRGELAAAFYGDPSSRQLCIGITGTNGKTSVAYHLADLSSALGEPMGYCGTLGWGSLENLRGGEMTTANAVALQRNLSALADEGMRRVALEISSHALDQQRARDVHIDLGVFTNLTRDHLDYHGSVEAYGAAKRRLFTDWPLRCAVINADDGFGRELSEQARCPVVTYGARGDWQWQAKRDHDGLRVSWSTPHGQLRARLPVVADYAVANVTAAIIAMVEMGHAPAEVVEAAAALRPVPGRMELISVSRRVATAVVDYAHTPDALEKALAAVRPFVAGRLICVVGCGGDRDRGKRALMGAAASACADRVWLTSDNPRSEDPQAIIEDMLEGVAAADGTIDVCIEREHAIRAAIESANIGDVVLIAGKGHEDYQEIAGIRSAFDDRLIARQSLLSIEERS